MNLLCEQGDLALRPLEDRQEEYALLRHWLSQEDLAKHIDFADLCLAGHFNASIEKAKRTIPGKAYIYRAMEKPMILGENSANHELYSQQEEGIYFVEMGSGEKLAEKICEIQKERTGR